MTILLADPRVAAIPVVDVGEPLVDLRRLAPTASATGRLVRRSLASRLHRAALILPEGVGLNVVEGYRTATAQQDDMAPLDIAPHVAGAAVDLTLVDADGDELWMGSRLDATTEESDGACHIDALDLDPEVIARRRVLVQVLHAVGLVNYPPAWWHWSFGDRYWALVTGSRHALYGPVATAEAA